MGEGEKKPFLPRKPVAIVTLDLSLDLVKVVTCRYALAAAERTVPPLSVPAGQGACRFESGKITVSDERNPILHHSSNYIRVLCIVVTHR